MFPVGTVVRMSEVGRRAYTNECRNPHDGVGKVSVYREGREFEYRVEWPSGYDNGYRFCDLELVYTPDKDEAAKLKLMCLEILKETLKRLTYDGAICEDPENSEVIQFLSSLFIIHKVDSNLWDSVNNKEVDYLYYKSQGSNITLIG